VAQTLKAQPVVPDVEAVLSTARWPDRIRELAAECRAGDGQNGERALGELWILVNLALQKFARDCSRRIHGMDPEDIRDIASDKSLELLGSLATGLWDPVASTPAGICAFLASVARHGVVDRLRADRREVPVPEFDESLLPHWETPLQENQPASVLDSAEHARAIVQCARSLTPRARRVWYLRVIHDLSSADIASHPAVASRPAAVDVMLLRSRKIMKACMAGKGFSPGALPTGTFSMLWELIASDSASTPPARPEVSPK